MWNKIKSLFTNSSQGECTPDIPSQIGMVKCESEEVAEPIQSETEDINRSDEKETVSEVIDVDLISTEYNLPPIELFQETNLLIPAVEDLASIKARLEWVLASYGIQDFVVTLIPSYRVSMYEIEISPKYVGKIVRNEKDILMALGTNGCRLINPLPNKLALGIEIPNPMYDTAKGIREFIRSTENSSGDLNLLIPVGIDSTNNLITLNLGKESSLLVCGASQQGKTDLLRLFVTTLIAHNTPENIKFVFAASNSIGLNEFEAINPMFLAKYDSIAENVISGGTSILKVLWGLNKEKEIRIELFKKAGASTIEEYNDLFLKRMLNPADGHHYLPHIVMCIDEFAPIFDEKSWDDQLPTLYEKIRGTGIHFIVTTKLTSASNLTPLIRTYFENRICFRIQMPNESRLAVNSTLATALLQCGDALVCANGSVKRCQTVRCDADSIKDLIEHTNEIPIQLPYLLPENPDWWEEPIQTVVDVDPLFEDVARMVVQAGNASTSSIQRTWRIGYNRAGMILDQLESAGIVGPAVGGKSRSVLVSTLELENILKAYAT